MGISVGGSIASAAMRLPSDPPTATPYRGNPHHNVDAAIYPDARPARGLLRGPVLRPSSGPTVTWVGETE
jgi:hypothetical protein